MKNKTLVKLAAIVLAVGFQLACSGVGQVVDGPPAETVPPPGNPPPPDGPTGPTAPTPPGSGPIGIR